MLVLFPTTFEMELLSYPSKSRESSSMVQSQMVSNFRVTSADRKCSDTTLSVPTTMCCHHISCIRLGTWSNSFVAAQSADPAENYWLQKVPCWIMSLIWLTLQLDPRQVKRWEALLEPALHQTVSRKTGKSRGLFVCSISDCSEDGLCNSLLISQRTFSTQQCSDLGVVSIQPYGKF